MFFRSMAVFDICNMESFNGWYQDWSGAAPQAVSVMLFDSYLQIGFIGSDKRIRWMIAEADLRLSFDSAETEIRHHTQSGSVRIPGRFAYDRLERRKAQEVLPWHKRPRGKEWVRNGSFLVGFVAMVFVVYNLIVPYLAEELSSTISVDTEQQLGDGVYDVLSADFQIDTSRTRLVSDFFQAMKVSTAYSIRIVVVKSSELNAFALPGGRIVVYSGLLDKMKSSPELAALLAHEFTHVDQRHATRSIFRQLGSQVFLGLVLGNLGSVGTVLIENADQLRSLTYSRELEKEADLKGLKLLTDRGVDPKGFEELFDRLWSDEAGTIPEFMASHPDIDNRIAYIKEKSKGVRVKQQPELDTIFAKLKL
jgi:Zn-dependent protease with chaperone function